MVKMDSLFDDALFSELKKLSAEELLIKCIGIIEGLDIPVTWPKDHLELTLSIEKHVILKELYIYCGELYRRNIIKVKKTLIVSDQDINSFMYLYKKILFDGCSICNELSKKLYIMNSYGSSTQRSNNRPIKEIFDEYDDLICLDCKMKKEEKTNYEQGIQTNYLVFKNRYKKIVGHSLCGKEEFFVNIMLITENNVYERRCGLYMRMLNSIPLLYLQLENKLQEIQMVKQTMLRIMKTPLLTKELEQCMDEILDLNGNKISQMKEYLTEDQYRFVRSGAKFEELEEQQDMLDNLNKMLKQLKICAVGQSVLEPPIAYAILVPPAIQHLEKELTSHKKRQNKHEKDLEKLKCKI